MYRRTFMVLVGAAAATLRPLAAAAQQKKMPVIGFLSYTFGSGDPLPGVVQAFLAGLEERGHVAGRNVTLEYRWAESRDDRLPALAANLVGRKVDLIATPRSTRRKMQLRRSRSFSPPATRPGMVWWPVLPGRAGILPASATSTRS